MPVDSTKKLLLFLSREKCSSSHALSIEPLDLARVDVAVDSTHSSASKMEPILLDLWFDTLRTVVDDCARLDVYRLHFRDKLEVKQSHKTMLLIPIICQSRLHSRSVPSIVNSGIYTDQTPLFLDTSATIRAIETR